MSIDKRTNILFEEIATKLEFNFKEKKKTRLQKHCIISLERLDLINNAFTIAIYRNKEEYIARKCVSIFAINIEFIVILALISTTKFNVNLTCSFTS